MFKTWKTTIFIYCSILNTKIIASVKSELNFTPVAIDFIQSVIIELMDMGILQNIVQLSWPFCEGNIVRTIGSASSDSMELLIIVKMKLAMID